MGLQALLSGHTDKVNAVKFFPTRIDERAVIISGSIDRTLRIWRANHASSTNFACVAILEGHSSSVNCLEVIPLSNTIISGSADATAKVWQLGLSDDRVDAILIQTINIQPRFFPLALASSSLGTRGALILAVAGTQGSVQIYVSEEVKEKTDFIHRTTLIGHEGWIRSLAFISETDYAGSDLLLASASQDKYIRLWRVRRGEDLLALDSACQNSSLGNLGKSLSNKAHHFEATALQYSITFDALLLGHDDWIYTVSWKRKEDKLHLLSASADSSVAIWESEPSSGVWVCTTRLGEISAQKGSTTATGSSGGFWIGLWSPDGESVASLGRTGGWRRWKHDTAQDRWVQIVGVSGHVKNINGIAWAKDGSYLLSASSDQTTRLHAEWRHGKECSWHEFARPQIHGYDLNCVDTFKDSQFISGADEKLLRVFNEPRAIADMLLKLCSIKQKDMQRMPDAASIPMLGLSNKAIQATQDDELGDDDEVHERESPHPASMARKSTLDIDHPPLEDHLARHTLWPEREKLYGHGYEISTVTASYDGTLVATACKASSIDHAVIRLYETRDWREVKPPLTAHSLTVTCLRFSDDDAYLLSVGRDRQWTVFSRENGNKDRYILETANQKAHSRMILSASWAPSAASRVFATAGRDKSAKVWIAQGDTFECRRTIAFGAAVTAVDICSRMIDDMLVLACGIENGGLLISWLDADSLGIKVSKTIDRR